MSNSQIKVGVRYKNHDPEVELAVDSINGSGKNAEVIYINTGKKDCGKYGICTLSEFSEIVTERVVDSKKGKKAA